MKSLTFLRALALVSAMAFGAAYAETPQPQIEARESLEILKARYRTSKFNAPTEIELACMGEIYVHWFKEFDPIVKQVVPGNAETLVSYEDALRLANGHESDMATVYPIFRRKLPEATRQVLDKVSREYPDITIRGPMAPNQIYEGNFLNALNMCSSLYYVTQVKNLAPTVAPMGLRILSDMNALLDAVRAR